jgi:hypothetical protein
MSNERPSLSAVIDRQGFTTIDTAVTGRALNELHELLRQAPSIAAAQVSGAETGVPIPDSVPGWTSESTILSDEAAFGLGRGAKATGEREAPAKGFPWAGRRLRAALFIGVALAIFALGGLGGAITTRLLTNAPASSRVPTTRRPVPTRARCGRPQRQRGPIQPLSLCQTGSGTCAT